MMSFEITSYLSFESESQIVCLLRIRAWTAHPMITKIAHEYLKYFLSPINVISLMYLIKTQ